jgi:hypothetical protein
LCAFGGGGGRVRCRRRGSARVKNLEGAFIIFFFKTELVRFGSVFSVSGLSNRNRTEPVGFLKILIGLIGFFLRFGFFGYFFPGFLSLIGFSVFLLTPILECSYVGIVLKEMIKYHDNGLASLKAKQGDLSNYCFSILEIRWKNI